MESTESNDSKPEIPILMLGLDEAGKTTILYKLLKWQEKLETIPTIGYNVETLEFEEQKYTIWDIGGLNTVRVLWKFYTENKTAVIFVVDASDAERLVEAKEFLHNVMSNEDLVNAMLLVVSNKHDKANCLSEKDLEDQLDLKSIKQPNRIVETSALDRESLNDIMVHLKDMYLF